MFLCKLSSANLKMLKIKDQIISLSLMRESVLGHGSSGEKRNLNNGHPDLRREAQVEPLTHNVQM